MGPGFDRATAAFCEPAGIGNCQPIGGEALLLLNQEFTVPTWSALRGVLFLDAGNVWLTPEEVDLSEMRSSLGLGIRVLTPIGPIRFEYGHKLDRQTGESRGEYLIGIGSWF